MAQTLEDILLNPANRPTVITDLQHLVDAEVSDKNGVSGAVIKTGYSAVKKIKPGIVESAMNRMLPEFADALEPFYGEYKATGGNDFGAFLTARSDAAADALLNVTDERAQHTSSDAAKKVYAKLRPNGKKNVEEALPRLGQLIDRHAAGA